MTRPLQGALPASTCAPSPNLANEILATLDQLLRDRGALYARIRQGADLGSVARALVLVAALSAAAFGAAVGVYRGGVQVAYAAIKLPLVLLLSAAICAPTWSALRVALGVPASLPRQLCALLAALAMAGLVLAGLAPMVLLGVVAGAGYHIMALCLVGCAAIAGGAGLAVLWRAGDPGLGQSRAGLGLFLAVLAAVGAQMSWTLRPYLVRPQTRRVPFVRSIEGSFVDAAAESLESARGHYRTDPEEAPW